MQVQIPPNLHSSGKSIVEQADTNSDDLNIRKTTFDCPNPSAFSQAEAVSERTGSSLHFSPATKQLFGLNDVDPFNYSVFLNSPLTLSHNTYTDLVQTNPDLIITADTQVADHSSSVDDNQVRINQHPTTGGKSVWPGMPGTSSSDFGSSSTLSSPTDSETPGRSQLIQTAQVDQFSPSPSPTELQWTSRSMKTLPSTTTTDTHMENNNENGTDDVVSDSGSEYEDGNDSSDESGPATPSSTTDTPKGGKSFGQMSFGGKGPYYRSINAQQSD